ncbi:MAG: CRISPR-associated helicase Cas3' [Candidatus Asgardarchaeum sp.]
MPYSEIKDFEENETSYLLKHHHLTDLKYKEGKEDRPLDEALLLIESWQSEIIVTTFVQFLHTVIGFKNKFLKKYHNIAGSVILLDEVQNIPIEYWDIVEKIIKLLATHFGCYFILLTATKPLILKEKDAVELVEDSQNYFKKLNRVVIKSDINNRRSIDEFVEWLKDNYNSKKSYLIVANTIRSSKEIYEKIKSYNLNNCLFYLSTSIVPKQRAARIKAVKNLLNSGNKPILVSTQVVEAGVDLDFDTVIRDVGPVDSIIQIAGRCNREYNKTQREAYIFSLDHFANYVYGKIHPDVSKKLLRDQEIQESDFHELTNRYFEEVRCKINDDVSKYVWEAMLELRFYQKNPPQRGGHNIQVSEFQLIDEKGEYANIFVEIDEEAQAIWKEYCEKVYGERNFLKRRRAYLSIRKKFRSYIISVRIDKKIALPTQVCGLRYIPQGQLEDFYSIETGFGADVTGTFVW